MATSSFSLPSASGVVSLLNDSKEVKSSNGNYLHIESESRPEFSERNSSSSSSIQSPPSLGGGTGSSSDAGKDSLASTFTTLTDSSTDGSESGRMGEIKALRRQLQEHTFYDAKKKSIKRELGGTGSGGFADGEFSPSETSQSGDAGWLPSSKKQRSKESLLSPSLYKKENQENDGKQPGQMLNQERLAASPKPMNGSLGVTREDFKKDVPMNMHKATSMSESDDTNKNRGLEQQSNTSQTSTPGGKRRYPCSHPGCDKTFSTSGHAARHNRIHTGSKPYRCTFPGCNASFSRQDNSLQHYRTHVLHPKSRANGVHSSLHNSTSSLESTQNSGSQHGHESPLGGVRLDAETEATVLMGRKALEEGTAIAVVHEVIDGSGRKGEAVQRMVGQPRASRRGSSSSNSRFNNGHREYPKSSRLQLGSHHQHQHQHEEGGDDDEDALSVGTSFSHNGNGVQLPPPAATHPSYLHPQYSPLYQQHSPPPQEQYLVNQFSDAQIEADPWSQKAMSYPPPPHPYIPSRNAVGGVVNMFAQSSAAPSISSTGLNSRPYRYGQGTTSTWHTSQQRPSSSNSDPSRYDINQGDHCHYNAYGSNMPYNACSTSQSPDGSHHHCNGNHAYDHRRSHSLGVNGRQQIRREMDESSFGEPINESAHQIQSASLSPPECKRVNLVSETALSLLPVNSSTRSSFSTPTNNTSAITTLSPPGRGIHSRVGTKEMQLPLPPISKLPCSSDRSTSVLTPTTPQDDVKMISRSKDKGKHSDLPLLPSPFENGPGRVLPPMRTLPHSL